MMDSLIRFAILEALTLLVLLCVAMPLKYWADIPEAVSLVGPIHGLAFLVFLWFVARSWAEGLIDWLGALRLFAGALVPFGGFINERWLRRLSQGI